MQSEKRQVELILLLFLIWLERLRGFRLAVAGTMFWMHSVTGVSLKLVLVLQHQLEVMLSILAVHLQRQISQLQRQLELLLSNIVVHLQRQNSQLQHPSKLLLSKIAIHLQR